MATFRESFYELVPSWLSASDGEKVLFSWSCMLDVFAQRALDSLLCRMPSFCSVDALPKLGRDRDVKRGMAEPELAYRARLLKFRDALLLKGTAFEALRQIRAYINQPVMVRSVDATGNWYTIKEDGTEVFDPLVGNWNWDNDASNWGRTWLIIYPNGLWNPLLYGQAGNYGDTGLAWGGTMTEQQGKDIVDIAIDGTPQGIILSHIIVSYDQTMFDPNAPIGSPLLPDGTWGKEYRYVNGVAVKTRPDSAAFIEVMQ